MNLARSACHATVVCPARRQRRQVTRQAHYWPGDKQEKRGGGFRAQAGHAGARTASSAEVGGLRAGPVRFGLGNPLAPGDSLGPPSTMGFIFRLIFRLQDDRPAGGLADRRAVNSVRVSATPCLSQDATTVTGPFGGNGCTQKSASHRRPPPPPPPECKTSCPGSARARAGGGPPGDKITPGRPFLAWRPRTAERVCRSPAMSISSVRLAETAQASVGVIMNRYPVYQPEVITPVTFGGKWQGIFSARWRLPGREAGQQPGARR